LQSRVWTGTTKIRNVLIDPHLAPPGRPSPITVYSV
jgi:hypothetical protein